MSEDALMYDVVEFPLTLARDKIDIGISHLKYIAVASIDDLSTLPEVRIDDPSQRAIPINQDSHFKPPEGREIKRVYLTNAAGTGSIKLFVSYGLEFGNRQSPVFNNISGALLSTAVSVLVTATAIPTTSLSRRVSLDVYNNDPTAVLYLGHSGVTTTNGRPVQPGGSFQCVINQGVVLYGISTASINVRVLEGSQS